MSTVCSEDQNQNTPTTTAGTNDTSEEPEPTGGEEPEPTGGEEPEVYICVKADEKCAKINYVLDPLLDDWNECWADPPPCVEAIDQDDAIKQCEKKCTDRQGEIAAEVAMYNADVDNADDEIIKSQIDCDYDDDPPADRPRPAVDTDVCTPPANNEALPVWGGETPMLAYSGTASLTDVSGGSAGLANLWGYLAYETFACDKRSCIIRFDAIEGLAHDLSGTYTDGASNVYEYTLQDLDVRLVQAVEGVYYPERGTIVFPDVPFAFMLSTTGVKTDLASFGNLETVAVASGASGSLTKKGELTLNLSYAGTHGSGTLTLQTR